ncbi:MAG TPA: hypothetical protein VFA59_08585 [Vicinamibacterales bacterium]|nr:hypothetical protein [Vicinamibacterales bacterium]
METKTKRTWLSILIAAVIIVGVLAVTIVGGTAFFIYRHIDAKFTGQTSADTTFEHARARFSGQQPLITLNRDDEPVIHRDGQAPRRDINALHALVYDQNAGKLTHVDVPGWLIRFMSVGGHLRIANMEMFNDDDQLKLTLEDLERHGPGLIMDVKRGRGSQLLVWTE